MMKNKTLFYKFKTICISLLCEIILLLPIKIFAQDINNPDLNNLSPAMVVNNNHLQLSRDDEIKLISLFKINQSLPPNNNTPSTTNNLHELLPPPPPVNNIHSVTPQLYTNVNPSSERCIYNNQPYVTGDIVKTDQGWIRCTSTIYFSEDSPATAQNGGAVWTAVH